MEKLTDESIENNHSNNQEDQETPDTGQDLSETKPIDDSGQDAKAEESFSDKEDQETPDTGQDFSETKPIDDSDQDMQDDTGPDSFMELYEKSLKSIQEGELVKGEIVMIGKEYVLVDIGYKSEGQIRISEFIDSEGNLTAEIGDQVEVLLEKREDDDGRIILSKEKAAKIKIWDEIKEIYEKDGTISGTIISRLKGGMAVDIGLQAFLPGSQIDLKPIRNFDALIGTVQDFKILKYNRRRSNIVLSRRAILEIERKSLREKTLQILEEGAVLEGTVKNITDYGLFIDLGGIDGLLHITDMSWGRVGHPSEMYQFGDKITVKVMKFDREKERVSLGLKQLKPDPWFKADEKYPVSTRIEGRVVSLADYGAFIEVDEGIEGLIHVSEMSWTRKVRHPSQVLKVGVLVEAVVLNIDVPNKRISLGLKQVEPNPWDIIGEKYPIGTTIEGRIKNITDFGIFIGIDEGIDGLVHISDISWTKRIKHPSELYKKGQEIQAVVLNIDEANERFSLGIKQLSVDPWDEIPEKYKQGTRITGTVTNITDFGVFVELEEGIEGLIHVSELTKEKGGNPLSRFKVDDVIQAKVINLSREDKKIGLSVRKLEETEEKNIYRSYLNNHNEATSNLGELLKAGMLDLEARTLSEEQQAEDSDKEVSDKESDVDSPSDETQDEEQNAEDDQQAEDSAADSPPDETQNEEQDQGDNEEDEPES
ncbi:MAG: 30S ribosomal protein S1 [Deltaproteobacteria bacterium]|nr:30S ribosomal protein S1 [Deltaproteobacteria bacterium]